MLLTKIKSAALVLLLAASVSVGTVGLTYRTATAQTGPGPQTAAEAQEWVNRPQTKVEAARAEKAPLESLRLEVEALRASLQATKQRVKALEAVVQAQQKPAGGGFIGTADGPGIGGSAAKPEATIGGAPPSSNRPLTPAATPPLPAPSLPPGGLREPEGTPSSNNGPYQPLIIGKPSAPAGNQATSLAGGQAALVAEIDGIAKKLAQDPKNKEALEALDRAVTELKRLNGTKPQLGR